MTKQNKLDAALKARSPLERQIIKPVDVLEEQGGREEPMIERSNERSNERTKQRTKIRHTFDIYQDQLLSLKEIAIERQKRDEKRVLLGELVQEALDSLIANERSNERSNE